MEKELLIENQKLIIKLQDDLIKSLQKTNKSLEGLLKLKESKISVLILASYSLDKELSEAKTLNMDLKGEAQQHVNAVTEAYLKLSEAKAKLELLTRDFNELYAERQSLAEDKKKLICAMEMMQMKENLDH